MAGEKEKTYKHDPRISNIKSLLDFQATEIYDVANRKLETHCVLLIQGIRGSGKSYVLKGLLDSEYQKNKDQASITWIIPPTFTIAEMKKHLNLFVLELKSNNMVSDSNTEVAEALAILNQKKIYCSIGFSLVTSEVANAIRQILDNFFRRNDNRYIKAIFVLTRDAHIYTKREIEKTFSDKVCEVFACFTNDDSITYMSSPLEYQKSSLGNQVKVESKTDLANLANCFGNNPVCLKASLEYKSSQHISSKLVMYHMKSDTLMFYTNSLKALAKIPNSEKNLNSFEAIFSNIKNNKLPKEVKETLEVLCLLHNEDIPFEIVRKIYAEIKEGPSSDEDLNNFFQFVRNYISIEVTEHSNILTIPKYFSCILLASINQNDISHRLYVGMQVLTGLFSHDNRLWRTDQRLAATHIHIEKLVGHAKRHLDTQFKLKNQTLEDFVTWMGICKLHALLGQALVQTRVAGRWKDTLQVLIHGAKLIWDVVDSYSTSGFMCFLTKQDNDDMLDFIEERTAADAAKTIAKKCIKAGGKIGLKLVQQHCRENIEINQNKFEDFVNNYLFQHKDTLTREQAVDKLSLVEKAYKNQTPYTEEHLTILRETGNLLSVKDYQVSFLAERLCDFFHIYGRQELYVWREMQHSEDQLKKCEYYRMLCYHIAKEIRVKTGVCLLYEFIAISNSQIPRSLQNRFPKESTVVRTKRLQEAYDLTKKILDDKTTYFESGLYMATYRSSYTKLNAYKYSVKAANKMLKGLKCDAIPYDAISICKEMFQLAKDQVDLDMGPACLITAAKFFASTENYEQAFNAFKYAFETEKGGKIYGINTHFEPRPNTHAWAVANFAQAVHAYAKVSQQGKLEVTELAQRAKQRCKSVLTNSSSPDLKKEWIDQIEYWLHLMDDDISM